jgi:hypothetical protein
MKELKSFEDVVLSLERLTWEILSSEKGFSQMPKLLREGLADRLGGIRLYLLFTKNCTKEVTYGKTGITG